MASKMRNYYKLCKKEKMHNPNYNKHLIEVPFRMGVIAASGGGKTQFLCELLHQMSGTFEKIVICLRTTNEPLYEMLQKRLGEGIEFHENAVPDIDEFKDKRPRLIAFDDLILDRGLQSRIAEYYIRARKYNISCVYLAQSYFGIPKIIRQQFGYIILKKLGSMKDIKNIIRENSLDVDIDELTKIYRRCTKDKLEFLMLDLVNDKYKYRYCFSPLEVVEEEE
jgi:hypothetical protein